MTGRTNVSKHHWADTRSQNRLPFPVVMAGIGLILAQLLPGGLSGGQGFLLGFLAGILVPGIITLSLRLQRSNLEQVIKATIAGVLDETNSAYSVNQERPDERARKITVGKSTG